MTSTADQVKERFSIIQENLQMSLREPSPDFSTQPSPEHSARKRSVSERGIRANRQNALRSTGPTTARGKRNASRNAMKHGFLAREVVITAGDGKESLEEFHDLAEQLCEHYDPVGVVEESFVQTIATCWWRKARVIRAENGEIRRRLDTLAVDRKMRNSDKANLDVLLKNMVAELLSAQNQANPTMSPTPKLSAMLDQCDLRGHHLGLAYLRVLLEKAKSEIVSGSQISDRIAKNIFSAFYSWDYFFAVWCYFIGNKEGKMADQPSEKGVDKPGDRERAVLVGSIDKQLEKISELERSVIERENLAVDAEARSFSLPPADATDKLLRYEAHLDRQLYRAMDQLERLQRQRRGEAVPPPLNINLRRGR